MAVTKPARQYLTLQGRKHLHKIRNHKHVGKPYWFAPVQVEPVSCWLLEASTGEKKLIVAPATLTFVQAAALFKGLCWRPKFTVANVTAADCSIVDPSRFELNEGRRVDENMEIAE